MGRPHDWLPEGRPSALKVRVSLALVSKQLKAGEERVAFVEVAQVDGKTQSA